MGCYGITKKGRFCKIETRYPFCLYHRFQPFIVLFTLSSILAVYAGLYRDLIAPLCNNDNTSISVPIGNSFYLNGIVLDFNIDSLPLLREQIKLTKEYRDVREFMPKVDYDRFGVIADIDYLPKHCSETITRGVKSINVHITENNPNDVDEMEKILSMHFELPKIDSINLFYNMRKSNDYEYASVRLVFDTPIKEQYASIDKFRDLIGKNDLCDKFVFVHIPIYQIYSNSYPCNLQMSSFTMKDELHNEFKFIPGNNVLINNSGTISEYARGLKYVYTLGKLKCSIKN